MAQYTASAETDWRREQAFAYLADFATIAEWDPGVVRSRRLTGEVPEVGSRYEVISSFLGREVPLVYEILWIDEPETVSLRAETGSVISLDELTFAERPGGGAIVTYKADLRLKGVARLAELPMRLAFRRLGDAARDGLRKRLAGGPPAGDRVAE
jgi:Polyketide cyclase / dehydrase and lipid transport